MIADLVQGNQHLVAGDTGLLPGSGGDIMATTATIPGLLTTQVLHSETSGAGTQAHSNVSTALSIGLANLGPLLKGLGLESAVSGLGLGNLLCGLNGLPAALVLPNISTEILSADSTAACSANGKASVLGTSTITNLVIGGTSVPVTGAPNQTIMVGPLKIIVNEQTSSAAANTGSIEVRALHVELPGVLDVIVSDASSDVTCCLAKNP